MIKFSILSENGPQTIGFVFSYQNLDLLLGGKPIFFDIKECSVPNLYGPCIICCYNEEIRESLPKMKFKWCFVLNEKVIEDLRSGYKITCNQNNIFVIMKAGKDEYSIYSDMQKFIGLKTKVTIKGFPPSEIPQSMN